MVTGDSNPGRWLALCQEAGGLTFARFMEAALWSDDGYYARRVRIGGAGADFYTAAALPLFGATLANYVVNAWESNLDQTCLCLVEIGPGEGELAIHITGVLLQRLPNWVQLHVILVEPSPVLRVRQEQRWRDWLANLAEGAATRIAVEWADGPAWFASEVVLIANEVLDALPVERVRRAAAGWEQAYVTSTADSLQWAWRVASPAVAAWADEWLPLARDHAGETCCSYLPFFQQMHGTGDRVRAIFVDYGITRAEWAAGMRPQGTVRGYYRHQVVAPLQYAGAADITADVYWDYAVHAAVAAGFAVQPPVTQGAFLMQWDILAALRQLQAGGTIGSDGDTQEVHHADFATAGGRHTTALKQLVFPGGMGERFQVLECVKQ